MDMRSLRRALNLRLTDVSRATGIAAARISEAERGLTRLKATEQRAVMNFLRMKFAGTLEVEGAR
jgi:transcriptional regulator with XRE-family HTH domain